MSTETQSWLENNIIVGFTEKRGKAWWYRGVEASDGTPNHTTGPVPIEMVRERLFNFKFAEGTVESTWFDADGNAHKTIDPNRKTIINPKNGHVLYVPSVGFAIHDYDEWLLQNVAALLDGDLSIGSAGLLKDSAVAWVQVEVPDTIETPEGVKFRPFLTAATAVNGTLASTYKTGVQAVVCDNTLSANLGEASPQIKIRHSKNSLGRLQDVRDALQLVIATADEFSAQVKALCETTVSDKDWSAFLDAHDATSLIDPKKKAPKEGRGLTNAENVRARWTSLYDHDERVSPWRGTAFGVLQAVNTDAHHGVPARGADKAERNMLRAVKGDVDLLDRSTLDTLNKVLVAAQ